LEQDNVSFVNYQALSGFSFTIASIVGMTTGLPLYYTDHRVKEKMLGATGLGNVLIKHGYRTWALFPASGKFSLKENFLRRIGFQNIYDGERFRSMLRSRYDANPFDGVDDASLFEASKPLISRIIHSDIPYFIFMETINTHLKGYKTQACRNMGFEQETQADIVKCEDKIVYDFISWFMKQDPNAVVVLINDHNQRTGDTIEKLKQADKRTLVNAFINTDVFDGANLNRPVAVMDFFPTVIEAAGGEISGCRLGLGTALTTRCAKTRTLREKFGDDDLQMLMKQENELYHRLSVGTEKSK
jgi:phosphoglycerol transferase MdoB-like AlkP superfamily enzyme